MDAMTIMMAEFAAVLAAAIAVDMALGDPRSKYHPTAWAGALIALIIPRFAGRRDGMQRLGGALAVLVPASAAVSLILLMYHAAGGAAWYGSIAGAASTGGADAAYIISHHIPAVASAAAACILLKSTIAIRGMQRHAEQVITSLRASDIEDARTRLSMIVKRSTSSLDREHVISGVLESIGENTSDGATGPLFYYGLFGLPGAFVHRIVNTADSMAGYRGRMLGRLGWFAARADTVLNYAPARLTALAMVGGAALLGYDWRSALYAARREGSATQSLNSGYPMAALAGALNVRLEKKGHYTLGAATSAGSAPTIQDIGRAIRLMKATVLVFAAGVVLPLGAVSATVAAGVISGAWAPPGAPV